MLRSSLRVRVSRNRFAPRIDVLEHRNLLSGGIAEYLLPNPGSGPTGVAPGPDGNMWFAEWDGNRVGRLELNGTITEFDVPTPNAVPQDIIAGPDGNMWFAEYAADKIGRVNLGNDPIDITEFDVDGGCAPSTLMIGPDINVWFSCSLSESLGFITPTGDVTMYSTSAGYGTRFMTIGPDGNVWFTLQDSPIVGNITPHGQTVSLHTLAMDSTWARGITVGSDGYLWVAGRTPGALVRIDTDGTVLDVVNDPPDDPFDLTLGPDDALYASIDDSMIVRLSATGDYSEYTTPTSGGMSLITVGPDQNLWFSEYDANQIGKLYVLAPTGKEFDILTGEGVQGVVATFHDDQPGMLRTDYSVTINWGDGMTSPGRVRTLGGGNWAVTGLHTYETAGAYSATVTITDKTTNGMTSVAVTTVNVVDAPLPAPPADEPDPGNARKMATDSRRDNPLPA